MPVDDTRGPAAATPARRKWPRRLALAIAAPGLLVGALVPAAWPDIGAVPTGARLEGLARSPQYDRDTNRFVNGLPTQSFMHLQTAWDWIRGGTNTTPDEPPPLFTSTREVLGTAPAQGLRVTWFGHSSSLVEIDGARFLTDPVWGPRTSPLTFIGPSRFHAPPLALSDLPPLDAVVISHDHYDHLDASTIRELTQTVPLFVVPLGVGARLETWGVPPTKIVELDWWDEHRVAGVTMVATPARHFSGRSLTDRDLTLWASWAFVGPKHRVYFSGDTAMFPGFKDIGNRLGPFDIAMVETGAYNRAWADVHLGPEQALQAFTDVRGKLFMPVHWGTFDLALHAWTEPVERVLVAAERAGATVVVPQPGQSVEPSQPPPLVRWWPQLEWKSAEADPIVSSGLGPPGPSPSHPDG